MRIAGGSRGGISKSGIMNGFICSVSGSSILADLSRFNEKVSALFTCNPCLVGYRTMSTLATITAVVLLCQLTAINIAMP